MSHQMFGKRKINRSRSSGRQIYFTKNLICTTLVLQTRSANFHIRNKFVIVSWAHKREHGRKKSQWNFRVRKFIANFIYARDRTQKYTWSCMPVWKHTKAKLNNDFILLCVGMFTGPYKPWLHFCSRCKSLVGTGT